MSVCKRLFMVRVRSQCINPTRSLAARVSLMYLSTATTSTISPKDARIVFNSNGKPIAENTLPIVRDTQWLSEVSEAPNDSNRGTSSPIFIPSNAEATIVIPSTAKESRRWP